MTVRRSILTIVQITSFQGKKLHEIYGKPNEFHTSRRSWYLPISPAPDHPDANSKKSKKRFPTLDLASGAALRWDSYVNLRHVYKIDWSLLRPYSNPDTPWSLYYRFERESMIRMLAKGRILTTYEAGTQLPRSMPIQLPAPYVHTQALDQESTLFLSPKSDGVLITSSEGFGQSTPLQSDFSHSIQEGNGSTQRPPKAPPDGINKYHVYGIVQYIVRYLLRWPWSLVKRRWFRHRS